MKALFEIVNDRKIAIVGLGKYQQDFEYIFDELDIDFYIADKGDADVKRPVLQIDEVSKEELENHLVIICESKPSRVEECLKKFGMLGQGVDYIYGEELFQTLDLDLERLAKGRKIAFWGYTEDCKKNIQRVEAIRDLIPEVYVNEGETEHGISREEALEKKDEFYFVIVNDDYKTAYEQLSAVGLKEEEDFISYKSFLFEQGDQKPSEMMRKTVFAKSYKQVNCNRPFTHAFLGANGKMDCCCVSRINKSLGDFSCMDYNKVWNSNVAKVFRLSMINKTYCFCNLDKCFILNPQAEEAENERRTDNPQVAEFPHLIQVCIDNSCNLHCLSCRKQVLVIDSNRYANIEFWAERLMETKWLDNAKTTMMAGNGEVFFSKIYRRLLYENISEKRNSIQILSNGTLFNEKEFEHLKEKYDDITVSISMDSFRKEMFEKLRAGAKYETMMKNLAMLSEKRKIGEIRDFQIFIVVQMDNLFELPEFIQKCIDMHVDMVLLNPIHKGGIYTDESFKEIALVDENGALKEEVREVFKHPIFHSKQVSMGWFKNRLTPQKSNECHME